MNLGTYADWLLRVQTAVRFDSPEKRVEDAPKIALMCKDAADRDENAGVWHQTAIFYGYPERCNCFPCKMDRKVK